MPSHSYIRSPHLNSPPFPVPNPPAYSDSASFSPASTPLLQSARSSCPCEAWPAPLTCRQNLASTPWSAPEELQPRRPHQALPPSLAPCPSPSATRGCSASHSTLSSTSLGCSTSPETNSGTGGGVSSATTSATLAFLTKGSSSELSSSSSVCSAFSFPFSLLFLFSPEVFPARPPCAIEHRTLHSWHHTHAPRSTSPYTSMTWRRHVLLLFTHIVHAF